MVDRIEFILGDVFNVFEIFRGIADGIFMSPPWGGPEYLDKEAYDLGEMAIETDPTLAQMDLEAEQKT